MSSIIFNIKNYLTTGSPKLKDVPPFLLSASRFRTGLSPKRIASNIIKRQGEAGAISGPLPDGSENVSEKMEVIRVEEIINAFLYECRVDVIFEVGSVKSVCNGANGGGPITVTGQNTLPAIGNGIIR